MKIIIKDFSVSQNVPIQRNNFELRSDVIKFYKRVYGINAEYHLFQWDLLNTLEGNLRRKEYLNIIDRRSGNGQ